MKLLVTGGSGYLGRNFILKYKNKYDIVAPSSKEVDLTKIAALNPLFKEHKFDAVLHFAGKSDSNMQTLVEADNLIMFKNVQYMAIASGVKKLFLAGDAAEFDRSRPIVDVVESEFGHSTPNDAYGLGRYLMHVLAAKDKITTTLRFFSIYGSDLSPENSVVSEMLARGITGKKVINLEGDRVFSTIYIDDATKIIANFIDNEYPKGDYNIVSNSKTSYLECAKIIKKIAKKYDRDIEIKIGDKNFNELSGLNYKLGLVINNLKFTNLNTGLQKTYEYLCKNKSVIKKKKEQ